MRKLLLLAILLAPLSQAEDLKGNFKVMWVNDGTVPPGSNSTNSACHGSTAVCVFVEANDGDSTSTAQALQFCWSKTVVINVTPSDPVFSSNCFTLQTRVAGVSTDPFVSGTGVCGGGCSGVQYALPAPGVSVGSATPSDGTYWYLYGKIISIGNPGAGDWVIDGSPYPYKYALTTAGNPGYARPWPSTLPATSARLTASSFVGVGNVSDPFSVGSNTGNLVCHVTWGSQTGDVYDNGYLGYWMFKHSVPCDSNHVRLAALTVTQCVRSADTGFVSILADIAATTAQAIGIAWTQPSVVATGFSCAGQQESITGVMAYGGFVPGNASSSSRLKTYHPYNPYFNSASTAPFTDTGIRPAMLMTGGRCVTRCSSNPAGNTDSTYNPVGDTSGSGSGAVWADNFSDWQGVVDRATAAINTNPTTGRTVAHYTGDTKRVLAMYPFMVSSQGTPGPINPARIASSTIVGTIASPSNPSLTTGLTGLGNASDLLMGTFAGANYTFAGGQSPFLPGAGLGFSVTSSGANLPTDIGVGGQATAWGWQGHGASCVEGSATEPDQVQIHSPAHDVLLAHYTWGATCLEAFWKSIRMPWEANFIGDPLTAPFTMPASVVSTGSTLRGVTLRGVTVR